MKIALISSVALPTPPPTYGGLERVVYDLGCELARRGHSVTLFACKGSRLECGEVVETVEAMGRVHADWLGYEQRHYDAYKDLLKGFDIIHGHTWYGHEYLYKKEHPEARVIHTHHGEMAWRSRPPVKYPCLVGLSDAHSMQTSMRLGVAVRTAYNPRPLEAYPFKAEKGDRYLFMSRITPFKGVDVAVELARQLRIPLDVAGGTGFVEDQAYVLKIMQQCDGVLVRWRGEVSMEEKIRLYQDAKALIYTPMSERGFNEPFGLVPLEAMACVPYETQVISPSILAVHSREYQGELVQVETERGLRLTLTPNHEVLTNRGWLPAGCLSIGDTVYCLDVDEEGEIQSTRIGDIVKRAVEKVRERNSGNPWKKHNERTRENAEVEIAEEKRTDHKISRVYANGEGACLSGWNNRWGRYNNNKEASQRQRKSTINPAYTNIECVRRAIGVVEGKTFSSKYLYTEMAKSRLAELSVPDERFGKRLSPIEETPPILSGEKIARNSFAKVHRGANECWSGERAVPIPIGVLKMYKMVEPETIEKVRTHASNIKVYNLTTITGHYFANSIVVHNCGTPVVALSGGALRETVSDGESGVLCETVEELKTALKEDWASKIKPENCRRWAERFSAEKAADRYLELFKDALDNIEW
jgi:glycosyltransferase involved in cell wall biosynthesis